MEEFINICLQVKDPDLLRELFKFFLTIEEQEMVQARCQIIQELLKGELTQREIADKCKVSIAQITRGSNALKSISKELKTYLSWWASAQSSS